VRDGEDRRQFPLFAASSATNPVRLSHFNLSAALFYGAADFVKRLELHSHAKPCAPYAFGRLVVTGKICTTDQDVAVGRPAPAANGHDDRHCVHR
jgi:hypothetical protein